MSRASLLSLCIVLGILLAAPVPALGQTANATDIEISKQAIPPFSDPTPEAINVGERFRYELTVTNNGPNVAAGVTFTDLLPAGVSFFDFGSVNQFITCNQGAAIGKICTNGDSVRCGHAVDGAPEGSISCEVLVTMDVGESRKAIFSVD